MLWAHETTKGQGCFYEVSILSMQYHCFPFLLVVIKSPLNTFFTIIFKLTRCFIPTVRSETMGYSINIGVLRYYSSDIISVRNYVKVMDLWIYFKFAWFLLYKNRNLFVINVAVAFNLLLTSLMTVFQMDSTELLFLMCQIILKSFMMGSNYANQNIKKVL